MTLQRIIGRARRCMRRGRAASLGGAAVVAVLLVGAGEPALAGDGVWTSHGPYGGQVSALVVDPQSPATLYAAGNSAVFRSTDRGANWTRASDGIADPSIVALAIDPANPATLYGGSLGGGRVVKSTDRGATWSALATGPTLVIALAIPAQAPATIYAAQSQSGVLKSTDGGATWAKIGVATLPSFPTIRSLVVDPANPATLYAGEQSRGVFKSTDGGATWASANTGFTTGTVIQVLKLAIDPSNPATLYAAANTSSGAGLYKSTNGGASWTQVYADNSSVIGVQAIAVDPANPANVVIGTFGLGVLKSTNGGASFASASTGLTKVGVNVVAFDPKAPANLYAGTQNGLFASTNAGGAWSAASNGLALTTVTAVAVDPAAPTTVYAATTQSGIFKSVDGGDSWTAMGTGIGATGNLACNMPTFSSLAIDPANPATLYAGTQCTLASQVYKTTNGGANWTVAATGIPGFLAVSSVAVDPQVPATVYAGLATSGLYRSVDAGAHWSAIAGVGTSEPITSVRVGPPLAGTLSSVVLATNGDGPLVSTDGATTFQSFVAGTGAAGDRLVPKEIGLEAKCPAGRVVETYGTVTKDGKTYFLWNCETPGFNPGTLDPVFGFIWAKGDAAGASANLPAGSITAWATLPGGAACTPLGGIVANPADNASFYAAAACGVLAGTYDGQRLVAISAGLPTGMQVKSLATTPSGSDVYAGALAGGVWRLTPAAAAAPVTVVEFYNAALDHYFITWVADEIAKLDAGTVIKGWARTGQSFKAYTAAQGGTSPVCRYYIPPALGDSHFFGRGTAECDATGQKNPSFVRESPDFMQMFLPAAGVCPASTTKVYRVFSNRPDANHRYMTDAALRAQMTAKGWLAEGDGPDLVVMCAPQ